MPPHQGSLSTLTLADPPAEVDKSKTKLEIEVLPHLDIPRRTGKLDRCGLGSILQQTPATFLQAESFFVAWQGVLVIAYTGFGREILKLKAAIQEAFPSLPRENPGSLWPKTSLAALRDGKRLSLEQLRALKAICSEMSAELAAVKVPIHRLSATFFANRCHESLLFSRDFDLAVPSGASKPSHDHAQDGGGVRVPHGVPGVELIDGIPGIQHLINSSVAVAEGGAAGLQLGNGPVPTRSTDINPKGGNDPNGVVDGESDAGAGARETFVAKSAAAAASARGSIASLGSHQPCSTASEAAAVASAHKVATTMVAAAASTFDAASGAAAVGDHHRVDMAVVEADEADRVRSVLAEFDEGKLAEYWFHVSRDGSRESHYRAPFIGSSLVQFLDSHAPLALIQRFEQRVEEALPGMYAFFKTDSLHITLRALS